MFLLATLTTGKISSSADPLTFFKVDASLLSADETVHALLLVELRSLRLIEVEPLPALSVADGFYYLFPTSTDPNALSSFGLLSTRASATGLFLSFFSHSDPASQALLAGNLILLI